MIEESRIAHVMISAKILNFFISFVLLFRIVNCVFLVFYGADVLIDRLRLYVSSQATPRAKGNLGGCIRSLNFPLWLLGVDSRGVA